MQAFHNDETIKTKYLKRVDDHIKADNLIRGTGWNGEKGCAVGCTLESYSHDRYPIELGIPEWLARVEDELFEGMSKEKSRTWPKDFLEAINIGADLEKAKTPFLIKVLERNLKSIGECVFDHAKNPEVVKALEGSKAAVLEMIRCHKEGLSLSATSAAAESAAWSAARSAASAAWSAAWSAARSAARSAESARSAAWSAAWSAARSAASAAESAAWSAAWSAARSAESARSAAWSAAWSAARSAESAAESAAFDYFADEILEILKGIK